MIIPKFFKKDRNEYIFVKEYPNFIMYKNATTQINECFNRHELGLIKEQPRIYNLSTNKVKR